MLHCAAEECARPHRWSRDFRSVHLGVGEIYLCTVRPKIIICFKSSAEKDCLGYSHNKLIIVSFVIVVRRMGDYNINSNKIINGFVN